MFERTQLKIKSYRRDYTVDFKNLSAELLNSYDDNTFVIIDFNVYEKYPLFEQCFDKSKVYVIEASERTKTLKSCEDIIRFLISNNFKINHKLLAVGGGITQDVTAFVASVLYRGVEWQFLPTTLLAQADSCIGSKSSINFLSAKNALGTFYPPSHINCCPQFLETLDTDDIRSGVGEMLHYYLIENSSLIPDFVNDYDNILSSPVEYLSKYVEESLRIKKKMIEKDEFDQNERRVFNYGHTFGHAIESISEYEIPHGLAVTIGMDLANYVSLRKGLIDIKTYNKLNSVLKMNLIDYRVPIDLESKYYSLLRKDKKNIDNCVVCVLPYDIGDIRVTKIVDHRELKNIIHEYMSGCLCL